jgi:microcystin-dependent protein
MSSFKIKEAMESNDSGNYPYFLTGNVMMYIGSGIPSGWLLCNGAEYSKTGEYSQLFDRIGTAYGETNGSGGSGTTHFKVPDFINRYLFSGSNSVNSSPSAYGGSAYHTHNTSSNVSSGNSTESHYHDSSMTGDGGVYFTHGHYGGSYIGVNGSGSTADANKTGSGGGGVGPGSGHAHDGTGSGGSSEPGNYHGHNMASLGLNEASVSHAHTATLDAKLSEPGSSLPNSYGVKFLIKV